MPRPRSAPMPRSVWLPELSPTEQAGHRCARCRNPFTGVSAIRCPNDNTTGVTE